MIFYSCISASNMAFIILPFIFSAVSQQRYLVPGNYACQSNLRGAKKSSLFVAPTKPFFNDLQLRKIGSYTPPSRKEKYIQDTIQFLYANYWTQPCSAPNVYEVSLMLGCIYDNFNIFDEVIIFTSITMYDTQGFIVMEKIVSGYSLYYPRGLLFIRGRENYSLLVQLTRNTEFLTNPNILASYSDVATTGSISYYKYLMRRASRNYYSFNDVLFALYNIMTVKSPTPELTFANLGRMKLHALLREALY